MIKVKLHIKTYYNNKYKHLVKTFASEHHLAKYILAVENNGNKVVGITDVK